MKEKDTTGVGPGATGESDTIEEKTCRRVPWEVDSPIHIRKGVDGQGTERCLRKQTLVIYISK